MPMGRLKKSPSREKQCHVTGVTGGGKRKKKLPMASQGAKHRGLTCRKKPFVLPNRKLFVALVKQF